MNRLSVGFASGLVLLVGGGAIAQMLVGDEPEGRSWEEVGFVQDPRSGPPGDYVRSPAAGPVAESHPTGRLVVSLQPGTDAGRLGYKVVRRFRSDPSIVVLDCGTVEQARLAAQSLYGSPAVSGVWQDQVLPVVSHAFTPNDPYFAFDNPPGSTGQWHLKNGIGGSTDIRATGAWTKDRTGTGVVVGVIDDGVQTTHPDLSPNYSAANSWDFFGNDADPSPGPGQNHGTAVAGVAAARGGNATGGTGVAPHASLAGLRIVHGASPESHYADATLFKNSEIGVKNHSYGISAPYLPSALETSAIDSSAAEGTINVYSAGNDRGAAGQDTAKKAALNRPGAIVVGAVAEDGRYALYGNFGANLACVAPSSGDAAGRFAMIVTTDRTGVQGFNPALNNFANQDYTSGYGGTSSAAAVVSGVMAMLKQVLPTADARFAKHMLARTCDLVHSRDATVESGGGWKTNAAGFRFNQNYGFGLINATKLTELARSFAGCSPLVTTDTGLQNVGAAIPNATGVPVTKNLVVNSTTPLEEVSVYINATHGYRGDLEAFLVSPKGTESRLFIRSGSDDGDNLDWWYTTNAFWGEVPKGTWKVRLYDRAAGNAGTWNSCQLVTRGGTPLVPFDAKFVSQQVPTEVPAGSAFVAAIRMQNTGFNVWDSTVGVISQDPVGNTTWGRSRIATKGTIAYGGISLYRASFTAPTQAGTYTFQWRLRKGGATYFGPLTPAVQIQVVETSATVDVSMSGFGFVAQTTHANAGDTIRWTNDDDFPHNVEPDLSTPGMDSDATFPQGMSNGDVFTWQVPANAASGTKYYYHCRFHGTPGNGTSFGTGMTGVIVVD